jgi:hypothetical protein
MFNGESQSSNHDQKIALIENALKMHRAGYNTVCHHHHRSSEVSWDRYVKEIPHFDEVQSSDIIRDPKLSSSLASS